MKKEQRCEKICELLLESPGLRCPAIATNLKYSTATIERDLKSLKKRSIVEFRGSPRTGGYYLIKLTNDAEPIQQGKNELAERCQKHLNNVLAILSNVKLDSTVQRKIEETYYRNIKKIAANPVLIIDFSNALNCYLDGCENKFLEVSARLENITEEIDSLEMDAAQLECKFKYLLEDYRNQKKKTDTIELLHRQTYPYLILHPHVFLRFIDAIEQNLNGDSTELLTMVNLLDKDFYTLVAATDRYIETSCRAQKGVRGRNINFEERLQVFQKIQSLLEQTRPESMKVFFEGYWQKNKETCKKLGWNKTESLQAKYNQWLSGGYKKQQFPLSDHYPGLIGDAFVQYSPNKKSTKQ